MFSGTGTAEPADLKARLQQIRQLLPAARLPGLPAGMRVDRFTFDRDRLASCNELQPGSWLAAYDLSGSRPAVLDNWPDNDLY